MAMQAASLEVLEKANVPAPQARAIVQAIEIELAGARDTLATKQDLLELQTATKHDMLELRTATKQDLLELKVELKRDIAELRAEVRAEIKGDIASLRAEMHALSSSTVRQMYTALLGQMAVLLGIAYFFVAHLAR